MTSINETLLEEKLTALEKAAPWPPRLMARFESFLRSAEERDLYRVNPIRFSRDRDIGEADAIRLFLHAAHVGLFRMNWHLLCPGCGDVVQSFQTLRTLHARFRCDICQHDFDATLDDYIEVSFTVMPQVRSLRFHSPDSLPVAEYFRECEFSLEAVLPDGTPFRDAFIHFARLMAFVEPGGTHETELELPVGAFFGADRRHAAELRFVIEGEASSDVQILEVSLDDPGSLKPSAPLRPGRIRIRVRNPLKERAALLLIHLPPVFEPPKISYLPFLSGKRLLNTQTFRDLFRSEITGETEGIGVRDLTLLFTDLKGSTALYDRIGDLQAFSLVQQHFAVLRRAIEVYGGSVVKTIGDAVMASFLAPEDGMNAAFEMQKTITEFNERQGQEILILKLGVHRGPSIAVTLNDRLDYFGQTVNVASRIQELSDGGEISFSRDVLAAPGVAELVTGRRIVSSQAQLKGLAESVAVYKVLPGEAAVS